MLRKDYDFSSSKRAFFLNFGCYYFLFYLTLQILLKGTHSDELKRIKCVVRCAVVMAYHLILETSFVVDQRAMFSTIPAENVADILPTNQQSHNSAFVVQEFHLLSILL